MNKHSRVNNNGNIYIFMPFIFSEYGMCHENFPKIKHLQQMYTLFPRNTIQLFFLIEAIKEGFMH